MRLNPTEIEKIAKSVVKQIKSAEITIADEGKVLSLVILLINQSLEEEQRLEDDAQRLLNQHKKAMGSSLDHDKALRMIKEKLAKERNFIL